MPCGKIALPSRTIAPISEPVRGSPEGDAHELGVLPYGDVEHLEAVALEHRQLTYAGIVGEADDLLGRDEPRVDGDVHSGALQHGERYRVVDDGDREADAENFVSVAA